MRAVRRGPSSIFPDIPSRGGGPLGGSPFAVDPDTPASLDPPIGWLPSLDVAALTLVRPVQWARTIDGLPFEPSRWGNRLIRIAAPGGTHLYVRTHPNGELALWLPADLTPTRGKPFGLYIHAESARSDRALAATTFRRAIGHGIPLRSAPFGQAFRQTAMLCIHDLVASGASLRDIAGVLLDPQPDDWRTSSERSDLRRLADAAAEMVAGGYRRLLGSRETH